jgi:hypothetical protein
MTLDALVDHLVSLTRPTQPIVLAPCFDTGEETLRCLPDLAAFWTFYIHGEAIEDVPDATIALLVLSQIWAQRRQPIWFDFGTDGMEADSLAVLHQQTHALIKKSVHIAIHCETLTSALSRLRSAHHQLALVATLGTHSVLAS